MNIKTQKCKQHPDEAAIHVNNSTNDPMCVSCVVRLRRSTSHQADAVKLYNIDNALAKGQHSARLCFQVMAGIVPGQGLPEFTEEWWMSSEQWEALCKREDITPDHPENLFTRAQDEAHWYAKRLTDPRVVNWVRVDFIYF